jgi:trimethylamine-N-oxide reductase (cytochrome c)
MIFLPELPSALATVKLIPNDIAKMGYDDCPPHPTWIEPIEWLGSAGAEKYPLHIEIRPGLYRRYSNCAD